MIRVQVWGCKYVIHSTVRTAWRTASDLQVLSSWKSRTWKYGVGDTDCLQPDVSRRVTEWCPVMPLFFPIYSTGPRIAKQNAVAGPKPDSGPRAMSPLLMTGAGMLVQSSPIAHNMDTMVLKLNLIIEDQTFLSIQYYVSLEKSCAIAIVSPKNMKPLPTRITQSCTTRFSIGHVGFEI